MELNEARRNIEAALGDDLWDMYLQALRKAFRFTFNIPPNRRPLDDFDGEVRRLLTNEEQIHCHNSFILALGFKEPTTIPKLSERGSFEYADYLQYTFNYHYYHQHQHDTPSNLPNNEYNERSVAAELFMPDASFIKTRIALTAWDYGLNGAGDNVVELLLHACQVFVRNLITAMISKRKFYKIRDKKFQYGFNLPISNPFMLNYTKLNSGIGGSDGLEETQESKVEVLENEDAYTARSRPSLETAEQQAVFAYSCVKKRKHYNTVLDKRLLYETLQDNPNLLRPYEFQILSMLKLNVILES